MRRRESSAVASLLLVDLTFCRVHTCKIRERKEREREREKARRYIVRQTDRNKKIEKKRLGAKC